MYDRLLLYFRLARLTPYFSAYFIRDCRYLISCVILAMKGMASFRLVLSLTSTITYGALSFILFIYLSNIYCTPTASRAQ